MLQTQAAGPALSQAMITDAFGKRPFTPAQAAASTRTPEFNAT